MIIRWPGQQWEHWWLTGSQMSICQKNNLIRAKDSPLAVGNAIGMVYRHNDYRRKKLLAVNMGIL